MQKKVTQQTLIPAKTIGWFLSPDHMAFGLFNLLWCLLFQHKGAGYTYLAFLLLSLVYRVGYIKAALLAYGLGILMGIYLS